MTSALKVLIVSPSSMSSPTSSRAYSLVSIPTFESRKIAAQKLNVFTLLLNLHFQNEWALSELFSQQWAHRPHWGPILWFPYCWLLKIATQKLCNSLFLLNLYFQIGWFLKLALLFCHQLMAYPLIPTHVTPAKLASF